MTAQIIWLGRKTRVMFCGVVAGGRGRTEGTVQWTYHSLPDLPLQTGISLAKLVALGAKFSDLQLL